MTLALIAHLLGEDTAVSVATQLDIGWHRYASWDPFAVAKGLV